MRIDFFIPWKVQPKQSVRFDPRRKTHFHGQRSVQINAAQLAVVASEHAPSEPFDEAVAVGLRIVYAYRAKDKRARLAGTPILKTSRPDVDQLAKQILDVLQQARFFVDDARVARLGVMKEHGPKPGVHVTLATMGASDGERRRDDLA